MSDTEQYTSPAQTFLQEEVHRLGTSPGLRALPVGAIRDFIVFSWGPLIYRTCYTPETKHSLPIFLRCLNNAVRKSLGQTLTGSKEELDALMKSYSSKIFNSHEKYNGLDEYGVCRAFHDYKVSLTLPSMELPSRLRVCLMVDDQVLANLKAILEWSNNFDSETDWNLVTPPMKGVDNRQVKLSRGRFLGGCSGCNGTLCIRGAKQDYDDWGLEGWGGEEFFKYMRKAETFHPKPWHKADAESHGYSGPLHTEPHDLAPISELLLHSLESQGMPLHHDMFSTGDVAQGCGHVPRTVYKGIRTTGADFVTKKNHRNNITITTDTTVDRVIFKQQGGQTRASGVMTKASDGTSKTFFARKEIIISGGAYCSPAILLRSGIGPKEELEKHRIPITLNSPGVGRNLMDHLIVFMFYETEKAGLTNDYAVYHNDNFENTYKLWKEKKTGFLSTFPFGIFAFARLDERLKNEPLWKNAPRLPGRDPMGLTPNQPNIEFFTTECYGGPKQYDQFPGNNQHAFSMIAELFAPKSRGSVTLMSADPLDNPIVDCNYLDDPMDMLVLSEACRFGNEVVMKGAGTKDIVKGSWPSNLKHHTYTTREEWIPYVKEHATTCYHAAGTCAMGRDDNPMAVLDEKLQVRGVTGLRVADCSVMPTLHGGHTQMPAFGIGEKCADLIMETWRQAGNVYPRI